jgi:Sigma-70, region 4
MSGGGIRGWKAQKALLASGQQLKRAAEGGSPYLIDVPISRFDSVQAVGLNPEEQLLLREEGEVAEVTTDISVMVEALGRIPPKERDILEEFLVLGRKQHEIAAIHGCSQANVSYLISRSLVRLRWWCGFGRTFTAAQWLKDASRVTKPKCGAWEPQILATLWESTSYTVTAETHKYGHLRVRHIAHSMIERQLPALIAQRGETPWRMYLDGFVALIEGNLGVGVAKELPHWVASQEARSAKALAGWRSELLADRKRAREAKALKGPRLVTARPLTRQRPHTATLEGSSQ